MKVANVTWSGLFFVIVLIAELVFGDEIVATWGAAGVGVVTALIKLWQEYQAEGQTVHTMTRGAGAEQPGFWRRVLTQ